jgi:FkbM family methyltransferase
VRSAQTVVRDFLYARGLLGTVKTCYYVWRDQFRISKPKRLLRGILQPQDLVFDIGAFVGSRTFVFSCMGCRVVAVEPQPGCVQLLRKRFGRVAGITIVDGLVSASEGKATLWVDDQIPEIASTHREWLLNGPTRRKGSRLYSLGVESHTVDSLISKFGRPKYIKIDAEGHEREILQGLSYACDYVSFEIHRDAPQKLKDCMDQMSRLGVYDVNLTLGDSETFLFTQWQSPDSFLTWAWPKDAPEFADLFLRLVSSPVV